MIRRFCPTVLRAWMDMEILSLARTFTKRPKLPYLGVSWCSWVTSGGKSNRSSANRRRKPFFTNLTHPWLMARVQETNWSISCSHDVQIPYSLKDSGSSSHGGWAGMDVL